MTYDHYTDGIYTPAPLPPGAGTHPTDEWLAARGHWPRADRPAFPGEGYQWTPAEPPYALIDGASVPQGEWVARPLADVQSEALARVREAVRLHIEATFDPPYQRNCDGGRNPAEAKAVMDAAIADCRVESNRVELLIQAATDAAAVAAAEAGLSLPALARWERP